MSLPFNRLYLQRSARQHSKLQQFSIISSVTYDIHPLVSILVSCTIPLKVYIHCIISFHLGWEVRGKQYQQCNMQHISGHLLCRSFPELGISV